MARRTCTVEDCERPWHGHGYCWAHLRRWRLHGDPTGGRIVGDDTRRFWRYASASGPADCWLWTGKTNRHGYGLMCVANRWVRAHRFAYELLIGPIPEGAGLDHSCHDPGECRGGAECPHRRCVNPAHLLPATNAENHRSGRFSSHNRRKTHCPRGHEYTPENILRRPSQPNARYCRECKREQSRNRGV